MPWGCGALQGLVLSAQADRAGDSGSAGPVPSACALRSPQPGGGGSAGAGGREVITRFPGQSSRREQPLALAVGPDTGHSGAAQTEGGRDHTMGGSPAPALAGRDRARGGCRTPWANPSFQDAEGHVRPHGQGCGALSEGTHSCPPGHLSQLQPVGPQPHSVCRCLAGGARGVALGKTTPMIRPTWQVERAFRSSSTGKK